MKESINKEFTQIFILPADKRKGFRYDFHSSADEADVLEALATADIDDGTGLKVKT